MVDKGLADITPGSDRGGVVHVDEQEEEEEEGDGGAAGIRCKHDTQTGNQAEQGDVPTVIFPCRAEGDGTTDAKD